MNVLVSTPSMYFGLTFIPYIYGLLRRSCDLDPVLKEQLNWLKPIFSSSIKKDDMQDHLSSLHVDILALSCYEWNWEMQMEFAASAKRANPNCLVIAGGPQPDWNNPQLFENSPYVDMVIKGEGESPFAAVAKMHLNGKTNFESIPGVITRNNASSIVSAPQVREGEFESESPYLLYSEEMKDFAKDIRSEGLDVWANFETNRGCPYKCIFCDWGAATNSRIRKVELDRIQNEIEWFAKAKIDIIYITDANFGILDRDEDIVDLFIKTKETYGYPKTVFFNAPKNNPDRLVRITGKLHNAGMLEICIQNSLQSTQPDVLKVMKRVNMPEDKQRKFTQDIHNLGIPIGGALILGNPGETIEGFKDSMFDVMEWGMHDELRVFYWILLPNAPAANPKFLAEHKMKTIRRSAVRPLIPKAHIDNPFMGYSNYLIEHDKMSREDYKEGLRYSTYLLVLHYLSFTKYIALFLRFEMGVSYKDFYTDFIKKVRLTFPDVDKKLTQHFDKLMEEPDSKFSMEIHPDLPALYDPETLLFIEIASNKEAFYELALETAKAYSSDNETLKDLVNYNSQMMIAPNYNANEGLTAVFNHDWETYFAENLKCAYPEPKGFPKKATYLWKTKSRFTDHYLHSSIDFKGTPAQKLQKYIESVIGHRSSRHKRSTFQDYSFERVRTPIYSAADRPQANTSEASYAAP